MLRSYPSMKMILRLGTGKDGARPEVGRNGEMEVQLDLHILAWWRV